MATPVGLPQTINTIERRHRRGFGAWGQLSLKAKVGAGILAVFVLVAIIGPYIAPYNPSAAHSVSSAGAPSAAHLLGTTTFGQDVLSQLLVSIRATLILSLLVGLIAIALSVTVGISAGVLGGWGDEALSLFTNVFLVLPALPLLVVLLGYIPQHGDTATILVLSFLGWPWGARVIRAQTLSLRNRDFVSAATETGDSLLRLVFFEILPNEVSLIAASFVGTVLYAIGTSVALAFLGLADESRWTLGTMLYWAQSQSALQINAWWWFVPPGFCVAILAAGLVLLNFGIDELGNPRLRDAAGGSRIGRRHWRPADPTPVLQSLADERPGRVRAFAHSISRQSLPSALTSGLSMSQPPQPEPGCSGIKQAFIDGPRLDTGGE
ncbi:MAG: ABC transporter permease [Acidimicrobiales bacterium]